MNTTNEYASFFNYSGELYIKSANTENKDTRFYIYLGDVNDNPPGGCFLTNPM